ncbi:MAG: CopG family ribbon-helix-helix protein [Anaerolineae bacterium]
MSAKVLVSLPEPFLAEVDRVAEEEHRSRSELIREALRHYMAFHARSRPGERTQVQRAVASQDSLSHLAPGTGEDSTDDVRRWREAR